MNEPVYTFQPLPTVKIETEIHFLTCYKCGILFGVPNRWVYMRREDSRDFWCPNGHGQAYEKKEPEKPAAKVNMQQEISEDRERLRIENLQLRAELDQATARAAAPDSPNVEPSEPAAVLPSVNVRDALRRNECPECGKKYRSTMWLIEHARKAHGLAKAASYLSLTIGE